MSGIPTQPMIDAMNDVRAGRLTPYAAAKVHNVNITTMYRSSLYKAWKKEQAEAEAKRKTKRRA